MSQPFIGQIQPMAFNFPPKGWAQCDGQTLNIAQNAALFSLLGTTFGGNGTSTFMLPDLRSRVPMNAGKAPFGTYTPGEKSGAEQVTLGQTTMPAHGHGFFGTGNNANDSQPATDAAVAHIAQASAPGDGYYAADTTPQPLNNGSIEVVGNSQPHSNIQPYLAINWCIALAGIFPSRN
jgi:microcystin-dependent protein